MPPTNNNQQQGFVSNTIQWMTHPFNTQGSALNWWLFVGLIVIAVWMWTRILAKAQTVVSATI